MQSNEIKIDFNNSLGVPITFGLEPFGVFYTMEPKQTFTLIVHGCDQGTVGVIYDFESITVGTPSGDGDVVLFHGEKELFKW